jgi:hypothetical protein
LKASAGLRILALISWYEGSINAKPAATTPRTIIVTARTRLDSRSFRLAFLNKAKVTIVPNSQVTNPAAFAAAIRWQGYVIRLGLGMTRMRNHTTDNTPKMIKKIKPRDFCIFIMKFICLVI